MRYYKSSALVKTYLARTECVVGWNLMRLYSEHDGVVSDKIFLPTTV